MSAYRVRVWLFGRAQDRHHRRLPRDPGTEGNYPLQVLPRSDHEGLGVHLLKPPQPEPPRSVPFLGLPEERLYPHRAFAQTALRISRGLCNLGRPRHLQAGRDCSSSPHSSSDRSVGYLVLSLSQSVTSGPHLFQTVSESRFSEVRVASFLCRKAILR
jgi:hypothetical protein